MRSRQQGNRYLAGFVIGAAVLYLAMMLATTIREWLPFTFFLGLGLLPAAVAIYLGYRAWFASRHSAVISVGGLLVLLAGLLGPSIWIHFS